MFIGVSMANVDSVPIDSDIIETNIDSTIIEPDIDPTAPRKVPGYPKVDAGVDQIGEGESSYEIYYDEYGRVYEIIERFVLGYWTKTNYEYYDKNQRIYNPTFNDYTYRSIKSIEKGEFYRDDGIVASFERRYDTQENEISSESEGLLLLLPIIKIMSNVYGVEPPPDII